MVVINPPVMVYGGLTVLWLSIGAVVLVLLVLLWALDFAYRLSSLTMDKLYECNFSSLKDPNQPVDTRRSTDNVNPSGPQTNIDAYPFPLNKNTLWKAALAVCGVILEDTNALIDEEELKELARGEKPAEYALELSYTENGRVFLADPGIQKLIEYATMILQRFDEFEDFTIGVQKVSLNEVKYAQEACDRVEAAVIRRHPPLALFLKANHKWSNFIPVRTGLLFMNRFGIETYRTVCYRTKVHFLERLAFETTKIMVKIPDTWEIMERAYEAAVDDSPLMQRWIETAQTAYEIAK